MSMDKGEMKKLVPPICCYCDHSLSCAQCGMEQPSDFIERQSPALSPDSRKAEPVAWREWHEALEEIARMECGPIARASRRAKGALAALTPETEDGGREEIERLIRRHVRSWLKADPAVQLIAPNGMPTAAEQDVRALANAILALSPSTSVGKP